MIRKVPVHLYNALTFPTVKDLTKQDDIASAMPV